MFSKSCPKAIETFPNIFRKYPNITEDNRRYPIFIFSTGLIDSLEYIAESKNSQKSCHINKSPQKFLKSSFVYFTVFLLSDQEIGSKWESSAPISCRAKAKIC